MLYSCCWVDAQSPALVPNLNHCNADPTFFLSVSYTASLRSMYLAREFHQAWAWVALPSNSSGGDEMGLAAIGIVPGAGNFGGGADGGTVCLGAAVVLAVAFARVGDLGGTGGADVSEVLVGFDPDALIGAGGLARCFPLDTGGVGT